MSQLYLYGKSRRSHFQTGLILALVVVAISGVAWFVRDALTQMPAGQGKIALTFLFWLIAIATTAYLARAEIPHPTDSAEHQNTKLCRVGLGFAVWSFGFGAIGLVLGLVAVVLGVVAIVRGFTGYGIAVVAAGIGLSVGGFVFNLAVVLGALL